MNKITDRIRDGGNRLAGLIATTPYWAPIMPLGQGGEKKSVQSLWQGINPVSKLESYKNDTKGEAEHNLQNKAKGLNLNQKHASVMNKLGTGKSNLITESDAKAIARSYGFDSVARMLKTHDQKTLEAAFKRSGAGENAHALYSALKQFEKESGAKRNAGVAKALGEEVAKSNVANSPTPPSQPPVQPPAQPPPG